MPQRPGVVVGVFTGMEWGRALPVTPGWSLHLLGRFRIVGLWRLCRGHRPLVSVQVASVLVREGHRSQRAHAIVMCAAVWGMNWRGVRVMFYCDNEAVVTCLNDSGSASETHLAHLLRCLFFIQAQFKFEFRAKHIAGKRNTAADALSRNKLSQFFSLRSQDKNPPQAQLPPPTRVPPALINLLSDNSLTWTSPRWRSLFETILPRV